MKNTKPKVEVVAELENLRSEHWAYQMALAAFLDDRAERIGSFVQDEVKVSAFLIDPMRACDGRYRVSSWADVVERGDYD